MAAEQGGEIPNIDPAVNFQSAKEPLTAEPSITRMEPPAKEKAAAASERGTAAGDLEAKREQKELDLLQRMKDASRIVEGEIDELPAHDPEVDASFAEEKALLERSPGID